jgi:hypothetical protein
METFENETKFYREVLGISYEFGSRLRAAGVLKPDAEMADGRPLFSVSQEALARHWAAISQYKAKHRRSFENAYV